MSYFALLWKARTIERYRRNYEREKLHSLEAGNVELPRRTLGQKIRHARYRCRKRIRRFFRSCCSEDSALAHFCLYLRTDQTFPNFILKSALGFVGGIILTYVFFMFFVFQLSISLAHAAAMCSIIGVLLTLGLAFSYRVRCLVFLLLPQLFSEVGRYTLLGYALILILTGPAKNTLHNSEVLSESMACGQEQLKSSVRQIKDSITRPFLSMKETIQLMVESVKQVAERVKESLMAIHRMVLSIVRALQAPLSWLSSIAMMCNKKLGTPAERCHRALEDGVLDCRARLGPYFSWLCSVTYVAKVACQAARLLDAICVLVEFVGNTAVATIQRKLRTFANHVKTMLFVSVHIHHAYSFSTNSSRSASQVAAGIVTEIRHRADRLLQWFSWMSCITSLFLLLIIFRAKYYQHMYESRVRYDNRYITRELRELDLRRARESRDTVLPLNRRERAECVTTTSFRLVASERLSLARSAVFLAVTTFKLLVHMAADYSLYWVLVTIRYHGRFEKPPLPASPDGGVVVSGGGALAAMLRGLTSALTAPLAARPAAAPVSCLPDPSPPDTQRYTQIVILIVLLWMFALLQPYGLRLRHVVMDHYRPERARARAVWLYNHILRKRGGFLKMARRKLHREHKLEDRLQDKYTFRQWLDSVIPCWWLRALLGTGAGEDRCVLCGVAETTGRPDSQLIRCQTAGCAGVYCVSCFDDIGRLCTACLAPADYGDLSDISLEKGSSAESSPDLTTTEAESNVDEEYFVKAPEWHSTSGEADDDTSPNLVREKIMKVKEQMKNREIHPKDKARKGLFSCLRKNKNKGNDLKTEVGLQKGNVENTVTDVKEDVSNTKSKKKQKLKKNKNAKDKESITNYTEVLEDKTWVENNLNEALLDHSTYVRRNMNKTTVFTFWEHDNHFEKVLCNNGGYESEENDLSCSHECVYDNKLKNIVMRNISQDESYYDCDCDVNHRRSNKIKRCRKSRCPKSRYDSVDYNKRSDSMDSIRLIEKERNDMYNKHHNLKTLRKRLDVRGPVCCSDVNEYDDDYRDNICDDEDDNSDDGRPYYDDMKECGCEKEIIGEGISEKESSVQTVEKWRDIKKIECPNKPKDKKVHKIKIRDQKSQTKIRLDSFEQNRRSFSEKRSRICEPEEYTRNDTNYIRPPIKNKRRKRSQDHGYHKRREEINEDMFEDEKCKTNKVSNKHSSKNTVNCKCKSKIYIESKPRKRVICWRRKSKKIIDVSYPKCYSMSNALSKNSYARNVIEPLPTRDTSESSDEYEEEEEERKVCLKSCLASKQPLARRLDHDDNDIKKCACNHCDYQKIYSNIKSALCSNFEDIFQKKLNGLFCRCKKPNDSVDYRRKCQCQTYPCECWSDLSSFCRSSASDTYKTMKGSLSQSHHPKEGTPKRRIKSLLCKLKLRKRKRRSSLSLWQPTDDGDTHTSTKTIYNNHNRMVFTAIPENLNNGLQYKIIRTESTWKVPHKIPVPNRKRKKKKPVKKRNFYSEIYAREMGFEVVDEAASIECLIAAYDRLESQAAKSIKEMERKNDQLLATSPTVRGPWAAEYKWPTDLRVRRCRCPLEACTCNLRKLTEDEEGVAQEELLKRNQKPAILVKTKRSFASLGASLLSRLRCRRRQEKVLAGQGTLLPRLDRAVRDEKVKHRDKETTPTDCLARCHKYYTKPSPNITELDYSYQDQYDEEYETVNDQRFSRMLRMNELRKQMALRHGRATTVRVLKDEASLQDLRDDYLSDGRTQLGSTQSMVSPEDDGIVVTLDPLCIRRKGEVRFKDMSGSERDTRVNIEVLKSDSSSEVADLKWLKDAVIEDAYAKKEKKLTPLKVLNFDNIKCGATSNAMWSRGRTESTESPAQRRASGAEYPESPAQRRASGAESSESPAQRRASGAESPESPAQRRASGAESSERPAQRRASGAEYPESPAQRRLSATDAPESTAQRRLSWSETLESEQRIRIGTVPLVASSYTRFERKKQAENKDREEMPSTSSPVKEDKEINKIQVKKVYEQGMSEEGREMVESLWKGTQAYNVCADCNLPRYHKFERSSPTQARRVQNIKSSSAEHIERCKVCKGVRIRNKYKIPGVEEGVQCPSRNFVQSRNGRNETHSESESRHTVAYVRRRTVRIGTDMKPTVADLVVKTRNRHDNEKYLGPLHRRYRDEVMRDLYHRHKLDVENQQYRRQESSAPPRGRGQIVQQKNIPQKRKGEIIPQSRNNIRLPEKSYPRQNRTGSIQERDVLEKIRTPKTPEKIIPRQHKGERIKEHEVPHVRQYSKLTEKAIPRENRRERVQERDLRNNQYSLRTSERTPHQCKDEDTRRRGVMPQSDVRLSQRPISYQNRGIIPQPHRDVINAERDNSHLTRVDRTQDADRSHRERDDRRDTSYQNRCERSRGPTVHHTSDDRKETEKIHKPKWNREEATQEKRIPQSQTINRPGERERDLKSRNRISSPREQRFQVRDVRPHTRRPIISDTDHWDYRKGDDRKEYDRKEDDNDIDYNEARCKECIEARRRTHIDSILPMSEQEDLIKLYPVACSNRLGSTDLSDKALDKRIKPEERQSSSGSSEKSFVAFRNKFEPTKTSSPAEDNGRLKENVITSKDTSPIAAHHNCGFFEMLHDSSASKEFRDDGPPQSLVGNDSSEAANAERSSTESQRGDGTVLRNRAGRFGRSDSGSSKRGKELCDESRKISPRKLRLRRRKRYHNSTLYSFLKDKVSKLKRQNAPSLKSDIAAMTVAAESENK